MDSERMTEKDAVVAFRLAVDRVWGLNRIALRHVDHSRLAQSMLWIPSSALLLGVFLATLAWLFSGLAPEISATLLLIVWVKLSGTETLDALAHVSDLVFSRDKHALAALKTPETPALGTVGMVLLVLTLLLKWSLLVQVIAAQWWTVIVLMPVVGWVFHQMVVLGSRWASEGETAESWRDQVSLSWLWPQWLLLLTALGLASGWTLTVLVLSTWAWIVWWRKKLGGVTNKVAMMWIEIVEILWLLGLVLVLTPT
jgi:cobalamin synthase